MIRNRLILILVISLFADTVLLVGSVPEERGSLAENREMINTTESTENENTDDSNWPTYQHDFQRTGYTDEEGPVSNKTMWVRNIGISTAPVIWNGRIYFGTWFNRLYCLDAMSGEEIWNYSVGDHIWSTPTVWGGRVYFGCEDRNLYCLDAMSGEKIWNRTFPNVIGTSVAIWNNKIYVYVLERTLYCLDADSGEELWKFNGIALSEWASPAVYGGYVIFCSDMVYCLDAESGRMIWSYGIDGGTRATATIYDGKVYIGGDGWKFYCLNLTDGKVIWWKDLENVVIFPPAVHDNKVYVISNYLHCYNASNGEEIWSCEALDGAAPSLSSNGYVYYINRRSEEIVCADSEDGKKVWSYDCESPYIGYVSIWDGKLYAASSVGILYCFGNLKPIANFSYEPAQVKSGEEIRFFGEGKDDDGKIVNWLWDFGDGNHANGKNVSHVYTRPGKYTVSLTVVDDYGSNNTCVREIIVENRKPIAKFRVSRNVARTYEGIEFYDMSYDVDGAIVAWRWDFGDGEFSQSASVLHEYKDDGEYRVVLRVSDDMGGVNESVAIIRILNRAPEAIFSYSPDKPTDVEYVEFRGNGSDRDGRIVNWSWDFGDGNIGYGMMVRHRYRDDGVYNVSLMVVDDDGGIGKYWKEVVVSNVAPEVEIEVKGEVIYAGEKVRFYGKGGDIDGRVVEWRWDLGDTTHKNGRNVSHIYSDPGRYVVRLRVVDDDGSVGETSIEIVVKEKKESGSLYLIAIVVVAVIAIAFYFGKKRFLQGKGRTDENSDLPPY